MQDYTGSYGSLMSCLVRKEIILVAQMTGPQRLSISWDGAILTTPNWLEATLQSHLQLCSCCRKVVLQSLLLCSMCPQGHTAD